MTKGSISGHMLMFALPLLFGNLLQQLYNFADTMIVGRLLGKEALAAVGTAGAAMNLMLFALVGMSLGITVIMSELFGQGDEARLRRAYSGALVAGAGFTLVLSLIAFALSEPLLVAIRTPVEVLDQANAYLRTVYLGMVFAFLYNATASALRAVGDSKSPLIFLGMSVTLNIGLDLLLISVFHMGVEGAALATVISQALSGIGCFLFIQRRSRLLRLRRKERWVDAKLLIKTAKYACVCSVQQAVLYVGRLLVQGAVNPLGLADVAAYSTTTKIDSLALAPGDSLAIAQTTFTSQNMGAGNGDRSRKALRISTGLGLLICGVVALIAYLGAEQLVRLFAEDEGAADVVVSGAKYLRMMAPFYLLTAICNAYQGLFRGLGRMNVSLYSTLIQIPIRVTLTYLLAPQMGLQGAALATGLGWCCMVMFVVPTGERLLKNSDTLVGPR